MYLYKSQKARDELCSGTRLLTLRERGALFLADGRKTQQEMQQLLQSDAMVLEKLISAGYLIRSQELDGHSTPFMHVVKEPVLLLKPVVVAPVALATPAPSSNALEARRSLGATKMYLLDTIERMFVRKMPALAAQYRDQLRQARDREALLLITRTIIVKVQDMAGTEHADQLSAYSTRWRTRFHADGGQWSTVIADAVPR
jgi:hypothetical protein